MRRKTTFQKKYFSPSAFSYFETEFRLTKRSTKGRPKCLAMIKAITEPMLQETIFRLAVKNGPHMTVATGMRGKALIGAMTVATMLTKTYNPIPHKPKSNLLSMSSANLFATITPKMKKLTKITIPQISL